MVRLGRDRGVAPSDASALVEDDDASGGALLSLIFILLLGAGVAYVASMLSRRRAWSKLANVSGVAALARALRRSAAQLQRTLGLGGGGGARAKMEAEQQPHGGSNLRELNKRRHSDGNLTKLDSGSGSPVSPVVEAWELALPPVRLKEGTEAGGRELPRPSLLRSSATLPASVSASTATVWGAGATTQSATTAAGPAAPPPAPPAPPVADSSSQAQTAATSPVAERRFAATPSPRSATTAAAEEAAQAAERDHAWERHRSSLDHGPQPAASTSRRPSSLDEASQRTLASAAASAFGAGRTASGWFPGERPGRPRPLLSDEEQAAWVRGLVSPLLRAETWRLLYATSRDGVSLASLLRASRGTKGPALLLVRDTGGAVFGVFSSDSWCPHTKGHSFGNGECFVFRCGFGGREAGKWTWQPQGARVFQTATAEYLGVGGTPHFALWLDSELHHGSSGECSTFGSPQLSSAPDFQVAQLEVWHFGEDGAAIATRRDIDSSEAEARRSGEGSRLME